MSTFYSNREIDGTTEVTKSDHRSEFYYDLLGIFDDSNNNPNPAQQNLSAALPNTRHPTIIRPNLNSSTQNSRPAHRVSTQHSSVDTKPRSSVKKKPPPRPAPPKFAKGLESNRLPKAPPSYSKVLEEDIRACINAYSSSSLHRSSSSRSVKSVTTSKATVRDTRSTSDPHNYNLIQLNTPGKAKKGNLNVAEYKVTSKNVKQAGSAASFLNKNPKFAKHVVPAKYQSTVKVAGKTYDFVEAHKNDFKTGNSARPPKANDHSDDLLGSIEGGKDLTKFISPHTLFTPSESSQASSCSQHLETSTFFKAEDHVRTSKPKALKKPAPPILHVDLNAGWGDDGIVARSTISDPASSFNTSSIPEPQHSPPVLDSNEDLPSLEPQGITIMNYTARGTDEISFKSKEIILLLKEDNDRFYGKHGLEKGYFPKFCVDVLLPLTPSEEMDNGAVFSEHPWGFSTNDKDFSNAQNEFVSLPVTEKAESIPEQPSPGSNMIARALHDYVGDSLAGDISFQTGDKIKLMSKVNDDWLYGECHGMIGQFPATFIDCVVEDLPLHTELVGQTVILRVVTALYDFVAEADDELTFKTGDKICVTENVSNEWWQGYCEKNPNLIGIFPAAFVKADENTSTNKEVKVRALYQFDASSSDELSFKPDDSITVVQTVDDNWMIGKLNNKKGLFPASFVTNHSL